MKISFHEACGEVTGSCCLVETDKTKFLVKIEPKEGELVEFFKYKLN